MKICERCEKQNLRPRARFCSTYCEQRYRIELQSQARIKICQRCNKEHNRKKSIKYCSEDCMYYAFLERQAKTKREQTRIKKGLPLDHPRLIKPNGMGHSCTSRGYVVVFKKGHPNCRNGQGSIYQHVLIMSEYLGRPLRKGEIIHHKNGIRDDNRIENLELWDYAHPSGQRLEDKIKWYKEFLEIHGYKVSKEQI